MPRGHEPKSTLAARKNWEANRQKPSTMNITRRRRDWKKHVEGMFRYEVPIEVVTHGPRREGFGKRIVDASYKMIQKSVDAKFASKFAREIAGKTSHCSIVFVKTAAGKQVQHRYYQRYFMRPNLQAFMDFLSGIMGPKYSQRDKQYCQTLFDHLLSKGIDRKKQFELAQNAEREVRKLWRGEADHPIKRFPRPDSRYVFRSDNFHVLGLTRTGTLKSACMMFNCIPLQSSTAPSPCARTLSA